MNLATIIQPDLQSESQFMLFNVPVFLQRFNLSYFQEDQCTEYFINRCSSTETISYSLIFSYSQITKKLHVSRYYPELYLEANSKYMSAVCFYLLIHHCAASYAIDNYCHINLETVPNISNNFYTKLKDFNFHVHKSHLGNVVELSSNIIRSSVDTSMIKKHIFLDNEIPFLK